MIGWHHQRSGHEFEQTPGDSEGQGSLVCCSSWGKEWDQTYWLNSNSRGHSRSHCSLAELSADPSAFTSTWNPTPQFRRAEKVKVLVAQPCLTICNSMNCSPPGSSVHGVLQARMLEWVAMPFSRGSS